VQLEALEAIAPALAARIAGAQPHLARRFALRTADLACSVAGVRDPVALEVAQSGLERHTEVDELVGLWELEREMHSVCEERLGRPERFSDFAASDRHEGCAEAHAISAVLAALRPDARVAAREAAYEARAAGCDDSAIETLADQHLQEGEPPAGR
jgi:hypothetical protein